MKIYHLERNYNLTAAQQRKQLEKEYNNFNYLWSDGRKIHFAADEKQTDERSAKA